MLLLLRLGLMLQTSYLKRENYGHLTAITRNVATMKKDREIISSRVLNVLYADGEYEAKKFNNINNSS